MFYERRRRERPAGDGRGFLHGRSPVRLPRPYPSIRGAHCDDTHARGRDLQDPSTTTAHQAAVSERFYAALRDAINGVQC